MIYPRVLQILIKDSPTSYKRAAAFTLYRAIVPEKIGPHSTVASSTALTLLHRRFLYFGDSLPDIQPSQPGLTPRDALLSVVNLLANTEPSPNLISNLLSPLIPALYSLSFEVNQYKAADPQLKESVLGLLKSWGKIVDQPDGTRILWSIVEDDKDWEWNFDIEGNFWRRPK